MRQLRVKEIFYTLQGEGIHSGKAAWFIRFGGCDIGCVWCDTKDAWNLHGTKVSTPESIAAQLNPEKSSLLVLTGGEPLYYNLSELTAYLRKAGYLVHLETSGAYPLHAEYDWLCLSPKIVALPRMEYYPSASELKIVIATPGDIDFAESEAEKVNENCELLLQPEWNSREKILPFLVDYVKSNNKWRLSLQIHKYLNIP